MCTAIYLQSFEARIVALLTFFTFEIILMNKKGGCIAYYCSINLLQEMCVSCATTEMMNVNHKVHLKKYPCKVMNSFTI